MKELKFLILATEDELSESVAKILFKKYSNLEIYRSLVERGFGNLKKRTPNFQNIAVNDNHLVSCILTDLDEKPCASELINDWLGHKPHQHFLFRVAVKEIESWILADRNSFAKHMGLKTAKDIPFNTDTINDPKQKIISLAKKGHLKRNAGIIPDDRTISLIGPEYNSNLISFVISKWNPELAKNHSPSLMKMIGRIKALT